MSSLKTCKEVQTLTDQPLNYALAVALNLDPQVSLGCIWVKHPLDENFDIFVPTMLWDDIGPYVDRYNIDMVRVGGDGNGGCVIEATANCFTTYTQFTATGRDRREAICRAICGLLQRDEVMVPNELLSDD